MRSFLISLVIASFFAVSVAYGQTPPPGGGTSTNAPIDGFSTLLLAAGIGAGVRSLSNRKARNEN